MGQSGFTTVNPVLERRLTEACAGVECLRGWWRSTICRAWLSEYRGCQGRIREDHHDEEGTCVILEVPGAGAWDHVAEGAYHQFGLGEGQ